MKRDIGLFVSYAHRNSQLVKHLLGLLEQHFSASRGFRYRLWQDEGLLAGVKWEEEILRQIAACDAALLMLSPSFLGSDFIMHKELPALASSGRLLFPLALHPIDFQYHDLQGLQEKQVFFLRSRALSQPRSYLELGGKRREEFALTLFRQIEGRLRAELPAQPREIQG